MFVPAIRFVLTIGLGLWFASPVPASASATQGRYGETGSPVGHLSHADGSVTLLHGSTPGLARTGTVLVAGDQVHVAMGRAEITLVDGGLVQLDEHTRVALHAADRVEVIDGRVFVRNQGPGPVIAEAGGKRVHVAPGSAAEVTSSHANDLLVRVVDGDARIESSWGSGVVTATQSAFVSGPTGRPFVSPWVASPHDSFYLWAGGRRTVFAPPATFLPYAHPTFRQQEYARVLRNQHHAGNRRDDFTRGADAPPRADAARRGSDRRGDERSGDQTRRAQRRDRDRDRDDKPAPRTERRPAAKPPAGATRAWGPGARQQ